MTGNAHSGNESMPEHSSARGMIGLKSWLDFHHDHFSYQRAHQVSQGTDNHFEVLDNVQSKEELKGFKSFIIIRHYLQCCPLTGADPSRRQASQEHITSPK